MLHRFTRFRDWETQGRLGVWKNGRIGPSIPIGRKKPLPTRVVPYGSGRLARR